MKTIAIACDHGGYKRKLEVMAYLREHGYSLTDFGCHGTESMDYPDTAFPAAEAVASGEADAGIVICTTGIGVSICANKVPGVRCSLCRDVHAAEMTRRHNNANVLALGADGQTAEEALAIVGTWLSTGFEGDAPEGARHARRVDKIEEYAAKYRYFK